MEMNKALKQLVDTKGYEFLKNPMIVNILGDYNAFNEYHSSKIIFKTLVNEGYLEKILFLHENQMQIVVDNYIAELYEKHGLRKDVCHYVLNSILLGLGYDVTLNDVRTNNEVVLENNSIKHTITGKHFEIDIETEKRLNSYIGLLGIPYDECGNLLVDQGRIDDAIQLYKIGTNKGEVHCLVELIKLYMNRNGKENDNETKKLCNKYFNSFLDIIGDGDGCPDLSEINEEYLDMYAKGFYEIIPIALEHKKTRLFHSNVEFFIIGALGIRLYDMLTNEMEEVNDELNKVNTKREMGLLKMEDYSYFSLLESKRESIITFKTYLHSLINKIRKYEGQRMVVKRINE